MNIQHITDPSFRQYGKILEGYNVSRLLKEMEHTPLPADGVVYVPSAEELEGVPAAEELKNRGFGGIPVQIGYCNGNNNALNALEYHRSSEINIAVTDLILLLGKQQDMTADYQYDTKKTEAFLLPAGTVAEIYATTLHYAPCTAKEGGFKCIVVLPGGTNTALTYPRSEAMEDRLLSAKNKWLAAHPDAGIEGAYCGLTGKNIEL